MVQVLAPVAPAADAALDGLETTLPSHYYTDPAIFARERERIFYRTWQFAGHVARIPTPGDYFTFMLGDQSLVMLRGQDGAVRCFYNVCRHRAHELLQDTGCVRVIRCPYHSWTYRLDGTLQRAPHTDQVPGFSVDRIRLAEVRLENLCGFLFVNLDAGAEPMANIYPGVEEGLRAYVPDIDQLQPVLTVAVEEDCNWKVSVENYSECYHCRGVHPTFTKGVVDPDSYNVMPRGRCLRHTTRSAADASMTYEFDPGRPHARDYSSWFLWPSISFQVYPGNVLNTYIWRPVAVDKVRVLREWFSPETEPSPTIVGLAEQDRATTVAEDIRLVNSVQRGLASRGYQAGPLVLNPGYGVNSEHSILALKQWTLEALGDD